MSLIFIGGASIGLFTGLFFAFLKKKTGQSELIDVMSLLAAYGAYILAEHFAVSGVMSTLMGAVTLALALSLPTSLDYWWTIQSIAFGVVVFSLFVQAPTMSLLMRRSAYK